MTATRPKPAVPDIVRIYANNKAHAIRAAQLAASAATSTDHVPEESDDNEEEKEQPATDAVWRSPELVESILSHLSPRDLFLAKRISRITHDTIDTVKGFPEKMFLKPTACLESFTWRDDRVGDPKHILRDLVDVIEVNPFLEIRRHNDMPFFIDLQRELSLTDGGIAKFDYFMPRCVREPDPTYKTFILDIGLHRIDAGRTFGLEVPIPFLRTIITQPAYRSTLRLSVYRSQCLEEFQQAMKIRRAISTMIVHVDLRPASIASWMAVVRCLAQFEPSTEAWIEAALDRNTNKVVVSKDLLPADVRDVIYDSPIYERYE